MSDTPDTIAIQARLEEAERLNARLQMQVDSMIDAEQHRQQLADMGAELARLREVEQHAQLDQQTAADNTARDHAELATLRQQLAERDAEVARLQDRLTHWESRGYTGWNIYKISDVDALRARVSKLERTVEIERNAREAAYAHAEEEKQNALAAEARVVELEAALKTEREWVSGLTRDNGVLLKAADATEAGQMCISLAGKLEHTEARNERLVAAGQLMRDWIGGGEKAITERWDAALADNGANELPEHYDADDVASAAARSAIDAAARKEAGR